MRRTLAVAACLLTLGTACGGYTLAVAPEKLADRIDCTGVEELDYFNAPIRGNAATRGVRCTVESASVHIFERAPIGDRDDESRSYADRQGGSLENIDRLVGTGHVGEPGCAAWMLVANSWFILADDEAVLAEAERMLGGAIRPLQPVSPPASYRPPGCTGLS